ncbi:MAG: glycoside hydrolase domain-containing protein [Candidatus Latescibacterota bacterium]
MKRNILLLLAVCLIAIAFSASDVSAEIDSVWAVNDGEKLERYDLKSPNKNRNSVWDGKTIRLFGARNEIIAFQVIVESGREGLQGLTLSLPGLRQRNGNAVISYQKPAPDPTVTVGRPIGIFSVNYMNVEKASHAGWFYPSDLTQPAAPKDPTGWKPVQLVPENARAGKGGFPLATPPNANQAIWIELYTGKELPAGFYDGSITVRDGNETRKIPVELELFDLTLPDENSLHAMIYYESGQPELYHGRAGDPALQMAFHRFAHRQRIEFTTACNEESAGRMRDIFSGAAFIPDKGYEGPGEGIGNTIIPRTFYGPGRDFGNDADAVKNADSWMTWLGTNLPGKTTFIYMPDEPREEAFPEVREYALRIRNNPGPGKRLPVFVTAGYHEKLDNPGNIIDIWCSFYGSYDIARGEAERAHGDEMWIYNGTRPQGGAPLIDTPATDMRSNMWACFKHSIPVYFHWHADHWRHNGQIPDGLERNQNVWADPVTYKNKGGSWANGDGCLIYPGREVIHPEEDRGIEGPILTIVLANIRRGLQDHLYLTLARKAGLEKTVQEALTAVVPRVLSDVRRDEGVTFPEDGNTYEQWRYKLGKTIAAAKK